MSEQNCSKDTGNKLVILKSALPYMSNKAKKPMELIIQAEELAFSLKNIDNDSTLSACDMTEDSIDIEGMLVHIKDLCTSSDQELIDFILNFTKTQKLYQSYKMFIGNNTSNGIFNKFGLGNSTNMLDFFMSQLTPEQKSTFETLNMMMSTIQP